jgi:uncharacterized protein (TIGR02001 family)
MQHLPTTFCGTANPPKKSADACLFCFTGRGTHAKLQLRYEFSRSQVSFALGGPEPGLIFERVMGIVMKKTVLLATALAMISGSALAADMPVKAVKAPPPPAFEPWDFAFGSALMNDYIFRGITQSNHKPSVAAYFEPRYNINKDVQLYIGASGESISFPNRAAAEIDIYGGIRPTVGMFAFDFGVWGYLYPGGQCFGANGAVAAPTNNCASFGQGLDFGQIGGGLPINGNFAKKSASFYEGYAKVNITVNDQWQVGFNEYYSPNFLNLGAWGDYASITAKWTAPSTTFGSSGVGMYISGEFGRQWLGTSDAFYGTTVATAFGGPFPLGIPEPSYNTWNVGIGFTYKVFTLDLRYSDTNLSKGNCNAFTSDYSTTNSSAGFVTAINPGNGVTAFGSNWCGAAGIVKLSADLTAMTNLK